MLPLVTRFAPSPTGHLHIGGARTALFCWAFAKKNGGRFMIRIEDTDQARSSDESARGIMEDLAWLGIEWDDGPELTYGGRKIGGDARGVKPYFQAQRVAIYNAHVMRLIEEGKAYPAFETSEELDIKRKVAVAAKQTYRYDCSMWNTYPTPSARLARMKDADAKGERYVVRFHAPAEQVVVKDQVLGDVTYAAGEMDDFVIRKADGFPTYHFAVVVDDETMGVTHVLRAQEHLNNTPRHVALQSALRFRTPVYAHMPLIFNMDGTKMGKRDRAKAARKTLKESLAKPGASVAAVAAATRFDAKLLGEFVNADNDSMEIAEAIAAHFGVALPEIQVNDFRRNGYLPSAITNFISLLGWNPGMKLADGKDLEKFDNAFLAEHFAIDRIGKTNAKFDRAKLLSFNADAINAMSDAGFAAAWLEWCEEFEPSLPAKVDLARWDLLGKIVKPRAKTMRDGAKSASFVLLDDERVPLDLAAVAKNLEANDRQGFALLGLVRDRLMSLSEAEFEPVMIHSIIEQVAQQSGVGMGPVSQAIRVAIAGVAVSPGIGETLTVLGRTRTMTRIERCLGARV